MPLARRVRLRDLPAATWIVARAFSRSRALAICGVLGASATVIVALLRGGARIDADRTGFVSVQRRSWLRTAGALGVLAVIGVAVALVLVVAFALLLGLVPALVLLVVVLLVLAGSASCFAASLLTGMDAGAALSRPPRGLRRQLGVGPEARIWEVVSLAQLPGSRTPAALAIARETIQTLVAPGDRVVVQAGTARLRQRYLRLGFEAGPGDLLVLRR